MSQNETAGKTPAYAWVILLIVYLLSVSAAMLWFSCPPMANGIIETYIIGPAVGAAMAQGGNPEEAIAALNINADFGMLMTWVAVGAIVSSLIAIFLQNKLGIKTILLLSALCLVAGGAMAALSGESFVMLSASRVIAGLGIGFVAVSATTAVSMWFANDKRALAMALWATWVPVSILIEYNIIVPLATAADLHATWWVITVIAIIALALVVFAYRIPPASGQISNEATSLKDGIKFVKKRQVICLCLCFFFYTFVSHGFTTYNPTFFTTAVESGGMGWDAVFANGIASICTAAGIIAPVFGAILDRIQFKRKYVLIVIGAIGYVLACCFGFKNLGMPMFIVYVCCMIVANGVMVACLRPMMPMLVGRGGVTAVTLGLALITILEFGGQLFTNFYGNAIDLWGFGAASLYVGVPIAVVMVVCALLVKPDQELVDANAHQEEAGQH
ncbi:MAG: nitrate/nitrite transporter [Coriobacteriales bacterium]